jgi:hypothetical protein
VAFFEAAVSFFREVDSSIREVAFRPLKPPNNFFTVLVCMGMATFFMAIGAAAAAWMTFVPWAAKAALASAAVIAWGAAARWGISMVAFSFFLRRGLTERVAATVGMSCCRTLWRAAAPKVPTSNRVM